MTMPLTPQQIQQLFSGKPQFADAITNGEVHLKRYSSDPPRYEIYWSKIGGDIPVSLDNVEMLFSPTRVRRAIFERWKVVIEKIPLEDWPNFITILNDTVEEIDQPGASEAAQVLDILERWTERSTPQVWSASDLNHKPLDMNDYYYFKLAAFEVHALYAQDSPFYYGRYRMPRDKLYQILRNAGAETTVKKFKGKNVWVWQIPKDFNKPTEPAQGELLSDDEEEGDTPKGKKGDGEDKEANAPEGF